MQCRSHTFVRDILSGAQLNNSGVWENQSVHKALRNGLVSLMDTRNNEAEADSSTSMQSKDISDPFHMPQPRLNGYVRIKFKQRCFQR